MNSKTSLISLGLALGFSTSLSAQEPAPAEPFSDYSASMTSMEGPETAQAYGPNTNWTVYHPSKCNVPAGSLFEDTYWYSSATTTRCFIQLDLPNGAVVDRIHAPVVDATANGYVQIRLKGMQSRSGFDSTADIKYFGLASTGLNLAPGSTTLFLTPISPLTVFSWGDFDNDGEGDLAYVLEAHFIKDAADDLYATGLFSITVEWHRTISPGPATATFSDVPTDHWAYDQVEAMVNAGITNGCDVGQFCPDANVTRAQMAVFLSKALGLHWPW